MSLRTYPLIVHPAFLRFIESSEGRAGALANLDPVKVPVHRPALGSAYEIAHYLGVAPDVIRYVTRYKSKNYQSFEFTKRSGGKRKIDAPRTFLKVIQWWILDTILSDVPNCDHVYGFVRGRSFIDNAKAHVGSKHILNVDVRDFFPSVTEEQVAAVFLSLGYSIDTSSQLADLTTLNGRLPQGAPTSPSLANLCFQRSDVALKFIADAYGLRFTRYADDLTFSSKDTRIPSGLVNVVEDTIRLQGFYLNPKKTVFMGVNDSKEVTGLVVGESEVSLPKDYLNRARGWFHSVEMRPAAYLGKIESLRGTLELIRQVGGRGAPLLLERGSRALKAVEIEALVAAGN